MVEVIKIWRPVESGGEAVSYREGHKQQMKIVAFIVGGYPVRLEEGFMLERHEITEEESKRVLGATANPEEPQNDTRSPESDKLNTLGK